MRRPLLALLLVALCAPATAGLLIEKLINFKVTAHLEKVDVANNDLYFRFSGPMFASSVDAASGAILRQTGVQLGNFEGALVRFHIDPSRAPTDSEFFTFTCSECRIAFYDGAVLAPIQPPDGTDNIPMQGRALSQLGPIVRLSDGTAQVRGAGCGGTQEIAGKGELAGTRGMICMNGSFGLPNLPTDLSQIDLANFPVMNGESDCSIFTHKPE